MISICFMPQNRTEAFGSEHKRNNLFIFSQQNILPIKTSPRAFLYNLGSQEKLSFVTHCQ